jgi:mRNA-degrading endonuclease RelE of RelBE toxin-antitoxin system
VSFRVLLHPRAAKFLERLDAATAARIKESLKHLEQHPPAGQAPEVLRLLEPEMGIIGSFTRFGRKRGKSSCSS